MLKKILMILSICFSAHANASEIKRFELEMPVTLPDIEFTDENNTLHSLSGYKGKVLLLNFWATWCVPCVHEMPALDFLAKSFEHQKIEILPVSIDVSGAKAIRQFYNEKNIKELPVLFDTRGKAFQELKLQALPTTIIINKDGKMVAKILGELDWADKENQGYLLDLANK